ncbi:MAG: transcriptional regulator [Planctomycetota bacterium]|nr:transcriptional regulator [Planctomycetota bacterium]
MARARTNTRSSARDVFAKTRIDHASETFQDYVEAIDDIVSRDGSCRVRDLVESMKVSHVTVVRIVRRIAAAGLATKEPHGPIALTAEGKRMARASRERHAVVVAFLRLIGVPEAEARSDAEGMEHHVGPHTLAAMRRALAETKPARFGGSR